MNELNTRTCGIEPKCDHAMDSYEDIFDNDGRVCGSTLVCSKCGITAYEISLRESFEDQS
jgi:hypothetical protein